MPGDPVFIDTAALLALSNADDALHDVATKAYRHLTAARTPLLITQWVLAEFLNGASRPPLRAAALNVLSALRGSPRVEITPATPESWDRGLSLFADRPDKQWSFIDCISITLCQDRAVRRVLTHDHHFRQAGFQTLL